MITLKDIQIKLAEAIKQSGLTQKIIAEKLNVSQQTISHYVKGDKMPALDTLANLCVYLDLDANEILCITNNQYGGQLSELFNVVCGVGLLRGTSVPQAPTTQKNIHFALITNKGKKKYTFCRQNLHIVSTKLVLWWSSI